jgi:hypothetical protein
MNALQNGGRSNQDDWPERRTEHAAIVPTQKARQGATGHNVRYVLGFGLGTVVLAFVVVYLVYFG